MGWLFLLLALLALVFPPAAIVVLAMMVLTVFAKGMGMVADSPSPMVHPRRKAGHRYAPQSLHGTAPDGSEPQPEQVIDVRSYPVQPPERG